MAFSLVLRLSHIAQADFHFTVLCDVLAGFDPECSCFELRSKNAGLGILVSLYSSCLDSGCITSVLIFL